MTTDTNTAEVIVQMVHDPFLNTDDACGYLGIPKATLLTWRVRRPGYGPRAVKAGGRLKYRLTELNRWLTAHEETFTDEQVAAAQAIEDKPVPPPQKVVRTRSTTMGPAKNRSERWPDRS